MAISKHLVMPNGVPLEYWRIVSLTTVVNNQSIIEVAGYVNQGKREEEQNADVEHGSSAYIETIYINIDYDPNMSVAKAYEYLKTLEEFSGSEDVIDSWALNTAYYIDDLVVYDGEQYRCRQSHISQQDWEPPNALSLWERSAHNDEWVQPDSTNPYMKGDVVTHNGKRWESLVDNNVWEPSESVPNLWKEI